MRNVTVVGLFLVCSVSSTLGCATAPREAEPLRVEVVKPAPLPPPMIRRVDLDAVLTAGAGRFLASMPVEPYRLGRQFVGYRVLALYANVPPHPDGVHVGDVVTAVNEKPIARPEQFMKIWESLPREQAIHVDVLRNDRPMRIRYAIVD